MKAVKINYLIYSYLVEASPPVHTYMVVLAKNTPHSVLPKLLAVLPHNHRRINGQSRERNESCPTDCRQTVEKIWQSRRSNLGPLFSSPVCYRWSNPG